MSKELHNMNLKNFVEYRSKIYKKWQDSYNKETNDYSLPEPKEIDTYANKIVDYILAHKDYIDFEIIIESLTHIGCAPNILYDDNGHFAIIDEGFQTVCLDDKPSDIDTSFLIPKEDWKPTLREALNHYLHSFNTGL